MQLFGYATETLAEIKKCLDLVTDKDNFTFIDLSPKDGVCGLEVANMAYLLESEPEVEEVFAAKEWYSSPFDVEKLTVRQLLSVWEEVFPADR